MEKDILIIGAGPAGLAAATYATRSGYSVLLLDSMAPGGQLLLIDEIENYPGHAKMSGAQLAEEMEKQAESFGAEIMYDEVSSLEKDGSLFIAHLASGDKVKAKSVICATGATHRTLGSVGEDKYTGRGVSYCATCDGPFFRNKDVVVVGGVDTALTDALYLSKITKSVVIVHRRNEFRAQKLLVERAQKTDNISFELENNVVSINGDGSKVTSVTLKDGKEIKADGVFIFVGVLPNTRFLEGFVSLDKSGAVITDSAMKSSIEGFFAAGDCRNTLFRQVVTAASDGALAAHSADEYISSLK